MFHYTILSSRQNLDRENFSLTATDMGLPADIPISIEQTVLTGGKQQGSRLITLTVGDTIARIIPTRAMAIMDITRNNIRYGWDSPVKDIVHPSFIDLNDASGLGWLDGFNEMLARCGYGWAGHPGQDNDEFLTLHGRIQNTPSDEVILSVEQEYPYRVKLEGRVDEKRFKFIDYELTTALSLTAYEPYITVEDTLTNLSSYSNTYQAIYHSNFGQPILEPNGKIRIPASEISPFNDYAIKGLEKWDDIIEPTADFNEMVFNIKPISDDDGLSHALLENSKGNAGIEVSYKTDTLPVLTLWKNTDTVEQGYVVGIEPGTSFAYNRSHQKSLGLVPTIKAKECKHFWVRYGLLTSEGEVNNSRDEIEKLQSKQPLKINNIPIVDLNSTVK